MSSEQSNKVGENSANSRSAYSDPPTKTIIKMKPAISWLLVLCGLLSGKAKDMHTSAVEMESAKHTMEQPRDSRKYFPSLPFPTSPPQFILPRGETVPSPFSCVAGLEQGQKGGYFVVRYLFSQNCKQLWISRIYYNLSSVAVLTTRDV